MGARDTVRRRSVAISVTAQTHAHLTEQAREMLLSVSDYLLPGLVVTLVMHRLGMTLEEGLDRVLGDIEYGEVEPYLRQEVGVAAPAKKVMERERAKRRAR